MQATKRSFRIPTKNGAGIAAKATWPAAIGLLYGPEVRHALLKVLFGLDPSLVCSTTLPGPLVKGVHVVHAALRLRRPCAGLQPLLAAVQPLPRLGNALGAQVLRKWSRNGGWEFGGGYREKGCAVEAPFLSTSLPL